MCETSFKPGDRVVHRPQSSGVIGTVTVVARTISVTWDDGQRFLYAPRDLVARPVEPCEFAARRGHTCDAVTAPTLWCDACWPRLSAVRLTPRQIASYEPGSAMAR